MSIVLSIFRLSSRVALVIAMILACNSTQAQSYEDFKNAETISEKISISTKLFMNFSEHNLDSLRILGYDLLSFANHNRSKEGIHYAKRYLGSYMVLTANEVRGLELLRTSKNYFLEVQDYANVTELCNEIGKAYHFSKKFNYAIKWYKISLEYGVLSPDPEVKDVALLNLAQAYLELKKYELAYGNAMKYRDWVLAMGKYQSTSNAYAVLGKIALAEGEYDKAVSYFELNEQFASKSGSKSIRANAYTNIGISKFYLGNTEECLGYFQRALDLRLEVKNVEFICDGYLNVGGMYFELGQLDKAEENYLEGLRIASSNGKHSLEMEMIVALIELNTLKGLSTLKLEGDYQLAEKNHLESVNKKNEVDIKLDKELDTILSTNMKGKQESKWPFYVGALAIFVVFLVLAFRKKLV